MQVLSVYRRGWQRPGTKVLFIILSSRTEIRLGAHKEVITKTLTLQTSTGVRHSESGLTLLLPVCASASVYQCRRGAVSSLRHWRTPSLALAHTLAHKSKVKWRTPLEVCTMDPP